MHDAVNIMMTLGIATGPWMIDFYLKAAEVLELENSFRKL